LQNQTTSVEPQPKAQVPATVHDPKNDIAPVKIATGIIWRKGKGGLVAPLTIKADARNYALTLVDSKSNNRVLMIFVGGHQTFETKVPLGAYWIHGASGSVWYGKEQLFGPATTYFALDGEFQFYEDGNKYMGNTINMEKRPHGNLSVHPITPSEFNE
jgi:hypothetical protein